jgi:hypothetical protein
MAAVVVTNLLDQQDKSSRKLLLIKSASSVGVGDIVVIANQMKMTFQFGGWECFHRCFGEVCVSSEHH